MSTSNTQTTPVTGVVSTQVTDDPEEFHSFQETEQKRKEQIIADFLAGPECEEIIEERVKSRLQKFEHDKNEEMNRLAVRISREGGWLYKRMPSIIHRKKLIALMHNQSPFMDLFRGFNTVFKRGVHLGDCPASVAQYCLEHKPEQVKNDGSIIPKRDGFIFTELIDGQLGDTIPLQEIANFGHHHMYTTIYNDSFQAKLKGRDLFMLYEQEGFPQITFNSHAPNNRSIPTLFPNRSLLIHTIMHPWRSPQSIEHYLEGPPSPGNSAASTIPRLEMINIANFTYDYNGPRLKAMAVEAATYRIHNARDAWKLIEAALEDDNIPRDHARCGTPEQIRTDIRQAITNYRDRLIKLYTTFYTNIIHFKLTELCLHEDIWVADLLGGPNPLPKPPTLDRNDPCLSRAFSCGFNKDWDKQMLRYEDTLVSNTFAKFNMLFTNMHLALEAIVDSYNDIISLLGMSFTRVLEEFYPRSIHHIVPQITRHHRYYIPLSGPTGYLAWATTQIARVEALNVFTPPKKTNNTMDKPKDTNILDQIFRARKKLDPITSKPLEDLNLCLIPSDKISKEVSLLIAREEQNKASQQAHLSQLLPATTTSEKSHQGIGHNSSTTSTPADSGEEFLEYFANRDRRLTHNLATDGKIMHDKNYRQPKKSIQVSSSTHSQVNSTTTTYNTLSNNIPFDVCHDDYNLGSDFGTIGRQCRHTFSGPPSMDPRRVFRFSEPSISNPTGISDTEDGGGGGGRTYNPQREGRRLGLYGRGEYEETEKNPLESRTEPITTTGTTVTTDPHPYTPLLPRIRRRTRRKRTFPNTSPSHRTDVNDKHDDTKDHILDIQPIQHPPKPLSPSVNAHITTSNVNSTARGYSSTETTAELPGQVLGEASLTCPDSEIMSLVNSIMSPIPSSTTLTYDDTFDLLINDDFTPSPNNALEAMTASISNQGVNNISSVQLSIDELRVLALGLNFIIEPNDISNYEIYEALDEFTDTLLNKEQQAYTGPYTHEPGDERTTLIALKRKLKKKFQLRNVVSRQEYQQRERSYIKSFESNQLIANIRKQFKRDISDKRQKTHHQLSNEEKTYIHQIISNLRNNQLIVIKPADKNLGPTIMDRAWYIQAGELLLQDTSTFRPVAGYDLNNIRNELLQILATTGDIIFREVTSLEFQYASWKNSSLLELHKSHIAFSSSLADVFLEPFLHPENIQACREYLLPKLHKLDIPWPRPPPLPPGKTPPVRPICASISWITYIESVYLDIVLKPLMLQLPSYVANSAALVKKLEHSTFPTNCALLAADVESLYPSIDLNRGLDALNETLSRANIPHIHRIRIVMLTRWVLFNNYLEFNGQLYLQIRGTAMGTPCAVAVACIFMGTIERKAWSTLTNQQIYALLNHRFIDDFAIIAKSVEEANIILQVLNSIDPLIKITGAISTTSCVFLDLNLYKGPRFNTSGHLDLDVFQKPSNKFLFLPYGSYHHQHIFKGWVHGYIARLRLNCTDDDIYNLRRQQFYQQLQARGYPEDTLSFFFEYTPDRAALIHGINFAPRGCMLTNDKTVFKIRYSPRTASLLPVLKRALTATPDILINPALRQQLQPNGQPIICLRNSPNIAKTIISAKLTTPR